MGIHRGKKVPKNGVIVRALSKRRSELRVKMKRGVYYRMEDAFRAWYGEVDFCMDKDNGADKKHKLSNMILFAFVFESWRN